MSLFIEPVSDQEIIVHVGSHLDFRNAPAFRSSCQNRIDQGITTIIVNFRGTNILDKSGLKALLRTYQRLQRQKGELVLAEISSPVQAMLQLTQSSTLFSHYRDLSTALRAVSSDAPGHSSNGQAASPSPSGNNKEAS